LPYLRPYYRLVAISLVLLIITALIGLLTPWPLKILIDSVLGDHPLPLGLSGYIGSPSENRYLILGFLIAASLLIALAGDGLNVLESYINTKIDLGMVLDFRSDLFQHAQRLSLAFHDKSKTGMLMYAINNQADAAARLIMSVPPILTSLITLVGMFWITFSINSKLALASLVVIPLLYYSTRYYLTNIESRLMKVKQMEAESLSIVHEAMAMMRVIVAFGREKYEHHRFRSQSEEALKERVKVTVSQTLFSLAVNFITVLGTTLIFGLGAYEVLQGRLTGGELLVFLAYVAAVYQPLEALSATAGSLQLQFISLRIAFNLLDTVPEIKNAPDAIDIGNAVGRITFEDVGFSYAGRKDTLKDISFDVQAGEIIALVGATGAGKSTLISLIPRFYDPSHGRVMLDGRDIRKITTQSLRRQISIVLQEPLLFSGTIAENIRYGRLEANMDEIIKAAESANAHEFIMNLPKKYETILGERGSQLSGGERQRIAVARAFLKDAPILLLDEPTSSIDSKTEAVILDALDRLMVGRTTFMVAHRLSTIRNADRIIVINHGQIVEEGTHEELLQKGGVYQHLHEVQNSVRKRKDTTSTLMAM
jgi:ATP-binding cassette, subfamily B, bacterial